MAATGVLPFIRGVDLSGNDFKVRIFKQHSPMFSKYDVSVAGATSVILRATNGRASYKLA